MFRVYCQIIGAYLDIDTDPANTFAYPHFKEILLKLLFLQKIFNAIKSILYFAYQKCYIKSYIQM